MLEFKKWQQTQPYQSDPEESTLRAFELGSSDENRLQLKRIALNSSLREILAHPVVIGYGLLAAADKNQEKMIIDFFDFASQYRIELKKEHVIGAFNLACHKNYTEIMDIIDEKTSIASHHLFDSNSSIEKRKTYLIESYISRQDSCTSYDFSLKTAEFHAEHIQFMMDYSDETLHFNGTRNNEKIIHYLLDKSTNLNLLGLEYEFIDACNYFNLKSATAFITHPHTPKHL